MPRGRKKRSLEVDYSKVGENDRYIYSIGNDGSFVRTHKSTWNEWVVKPFVKRGQLHVYMDGICKRVDKLVAKHFVKSYRDGDEIVHINGNPNDCLATNLKPIRYREHLINNRGKRPGYLVTVDGRDCLYNSINEFSKAIYRNPTTIKKLLKGKDLCEYDGMTIRIVRSLSR